jgi:hypothetical protein
MLLQSLLRPVLTPLMRGMFDAPIASSSAWSPLSLWPDGIATPGMWISPRDLTSQWQDSAGTTPVSVPGTVADSANPVGLALDIRAGAPEVLGPELCAGAPSLGTGWTDNGNGTYTSDGNAGYITWPGSVAGKMYQVSITCHTFSGTWLAARMIDDWVPFATSVGTFTAKMVNTGGIQFYSAGFAGIASFSCKEIPGNHMLQSTSVARPLMSAYDGQTLGPGDTYDATGFPIAQLYDGVDDGMATAAFSAGTLTSAMDCMIPVRRDSAASTTLGLNMSSAEVFGYCADGVAAASVVGAGSPTVWVDGVQLAGGTSVLQSTMHTAVTVGDFHIVEWRGLDLSAWTRAKYDAAFPGYSPVGARGDIFLYPSTASTEDKDAARQYLADYYGVTLP